MARSNRKWIKLGLAVMVINLAIIMTDPSWAAQAQLTFKRQVTISGERILLGDLLKSVIGLSKSEKDKIMTTDAGRAPAIGRSLTLRPSDINILVRPDKLGVAKIRAIIPAGITIHREGNNIGPDQMSQWYRDAVMDNLPWNPDRVEIDNLKVPEKLIVPSGRLSVDIKSPNSSAMPGRVVLKMNILVDGKVHTTIRTSGVVRFFQDVVVAARPLEQGTVLKASDVKFSSIRVTKNRSNPSCSNPKALIGLQLKSRVKAGQALSVRMTDRPKLVKKGDRVTIMAKMNGLTIQTLGIIKDRYGFKGDQVCVMNVQTRREVYGRLLRSDLVQVTF